MQKIAIASRVPVSGRSGIASVGEWPGPNNATSTITKILLVMKLATVLLTTAIMQVHATGSAQTVTVTGRNLSLQEVFAVIEKQTGYVTISNEQTLAGTKTVSLNVRGIDLRDLLNTLLPQQSIAYEIQDKTIILSRMPRSSAAGPVFMQTEQPVNIRITNAEGKPLDGASVTVKGSKASGVSGQGGMLTLQLRTGDVITVTYVGYLAESITIKEGVTELNIVLTAKETSLEEVTVNKGYYRTTKTLNTGSVNVVTGKDVARQPVADPLAALIGRVPGLQITQGSGLPGKYFTVRLRGINSIANGNDPLYIVDGIPFSSSYVNPGNFVYGAGGANSPFAVLSPSDIENIEVLKDADATAIYGSRGANGVILITTRKGKAGATTVDVNFYQGAGKVTRKLDLMNTQEYLAMRREALANDGKTPAINDYDLNGTWDTTRYTDWQEIMIGGTSHTSSLQASVMGGNSHTQFMLGGNYRKESTIYPGNFFNRTVSGHFNFRHQSNNERFKVELTSTYTVNKNKMPIEDLGYKVFLAPVAPALYNEDGSLNWANSTWDNPLAILKQRADATTTSNITNLTLDYKLATGLNLKGSFAYRAVGTDNHLIYPFSAANPAYASSASNIRRHQWGGNTQKVWTAEPQLSYTRTIGNRGQLDVLAGITFQENTSEDRSEYSSGFTSDALLENISAGARQSLGAYRYTQYRYDAAYGRIGFNWDEKYLLNVTARKDGSSRFGPGKRFGNFGAVGAGWIFSREKFLIGSRTLSFGKLRASYGITGNDQMPDYSYLSTYDAFQLSYQDVSGLYPSQLTNPTYSWEAVKKLEAALELGFINNRIMLTAGWYRNRTDNQLVGYSLSNVTGFGSVQANLPAVIQNTGLELELNTENISGKNFKWNSSFNISFPRNKLVSYPNIEGSSYNSRYAVGQSLFVTYRFNYLGIDPETGVYTFEDVNKDGMYTYESDRRFYFTGQRFYGGLSNDLTYKGWNLNFFIQFVKQERTTYNTNYLPGTTFNNFGNNQPVSVLDRWQKPGDKPAFQKYTATYGTDANRAFELFDYSNGRLGDASYIRLRNASLSWQIPRQWTQSARLQNARLYIQCQNVLTFTKYDGPDPENGGDIRTVSPIRMITAGAQFGF